MLPTGIDSTQLNQSLLGVRPDEFAGESESEAEMNGEPDSPTSVNVKGELPEDSTDQDLSEDANYRETIRGVRSLMGWHQIPDYDSTSSSLDDNPFAGSRAKPTGKVSVKLPVRSEERRSSGSAHRKPGRFHPYASSSSRSTHQPDRKPTTPAWKQIKERQIGQKGCGKASNFTQKPAKG